MENENEKNDSITIKKQDIWRYSTFVLIAILIVGAIVFFTGNDNNVTGKVVAPTGGSGGSERVNVEIGDDAIKGDENAPITMIEFSDYECPFCGRHFLQTYPQIVKNYVDTGKVNLVFKDFPLSFHPEAQKAGEAAEAVKSQLGDEGYWAMHDKLFENQQSLSVENYKKWARELGADGEQFDDDLDSGKFANEVKQDMNEGQKAGISGTPGFLVNGNPIVGACPYSTFQQAFDAELEGKDWVVEQCQVTIL
jgi:protein-disulfide isomerase